MRFLYLLQPGLSIGTNRYKIGKSTQKDYSRLKNYGQKKHVIRIKHIKPEYDINILENKLIETFNNKFELYQGKEYFVCASKEEAIKIFDSVVTDEYVDNSMDNIKQKKSKVELFLEDKIEINKNDKLYYIRKEFYNYKQDKSFGGNKKLVKIEIEKCYDSNTRLICKEININKDTNSFLEYNHGIKDYVYEFDEINDKEGKIIIDKIIENKIIEDKNIYDLNSKSFIKKINKYKENIHFIISQKNTELIENNHYNFPYEDEHSPAWEQGETRIILERLFNTTLSINKNLFLKKKQIDDMGKNKKIIYFYNKSSNDYYSIVIYKISNLSNPYKKIWIDRDYIREYLPYNLSGNIKNDVVIYNRNYKKISTPYKLDTIQSEEYKKKQIEIMGNTDYFYKDGGNPICNGINVLKKYLNIIERLHNNKIINLSNLDEDSQKLLKILKG